MEAKKDRVELSSGNNAYAYAGMLGVFPGEDDLRYGYDGIANWEQPLSQTDRDEICGYMIALWTRWARGEFKNG